MFKLTEEQKQILMELLDEPETAVGASLMSQNSFYVLKAINDEIKADGLDWQYELNPKGARLQKLYEELYAEYPPQKP